MKNLFMYFYNNFSYIFTSIKNSNFSSLNTRMAPMYNYYQYTNSIDDIKEFLTSSYVSVGSCGFIFMFAAPQATCIYMKQHASYCSFIFFRWDGNISYYYFSGSSWSLKTL